MCFHNKQHPLPAWFICDLNLSILAESRQPWMTCVTSDSRNVSMSQRGFLLDELHFAHKNVTVEEICITHSFDFDLFENVFLMRVCTFKKKVMWCFTDLYFVLKKEICFKIMPSDSWQTLWAVNILYIVCVFLFLFVRCLINENDNDFWN